MLTVDGLQVVRFARDDPRSMKELQGLLERCSDYYELHEGEPARPSAATDEFDHVPPEIPREDLFILGFRDGDDFIAEMSLVRDYPKAGEWWIALFVVDPRRRGRGYGTRICDAMLAWLAASTIVLAVDEENPRGDAFWRSFGFLEARRTGYTAPTGAQRRVVIMRRPMP